MRELIEKFLDDTGIDISRDNYRGTLKELLISDLEDVALATALILKNEMLSGNNFSKNKALEIAKDFVASNHNDQDWEKIDFEEEVLKFSKNY